MAEKMTAEERRNRIQKQHDAAEKKLQRAREAARRARIDADMALLSLIREQTLDGLDWDDWSEITAAAIPDGASTVLDALTMTADRIVQAREAEIERRRAEAERKKAVVSEPSDSDDEIG